jgi:cyclophilin family peptidyl-prolyl cis-trans isomerase
MRLVWHAVGCAAVWATVCLMAQAQEKSEKGEKAPAVPTAKAKAKEEPQQPPAGKAKGKEVPKASEPAASEPPATAEQFPELHKRWQDLDAQLNGLAEQFAKAPSAEEKKVIRTRYVKLVQESEKLLPQLRSAAEAAFAAAPGKDPDVTKIVMGLVAFEYRRDDYEAALKLAKALFDVEVTEPALYAVAGAAAYHTDDYDQAEKWLTMAKDANKLDLEMTALLTDLPKRREAWAKEQEIRQKEAEADDLPRVKLETTKGTIVIELFENEAPQTVGNFVSLVEAKKYDGTLFHRVLPGFMAQGGDPQGTGIGGPGYTIYDELEGENYRRHFRGSLSMANEGQPNSGGSQFFLAFRATTHLDGKHTVFGRVIEGIDVLAKLQRRSPGAGPDIDLPAADKIIKAEVVRKREHDYKPTKVEKKEPAEGKGVKGKAEKSQPKEGKKTP